MNRRPPSIFLFLLFLGAGILWSAFSFFSNLESIRAALDASPGAPPALYFGMRIGSMALAAGAAILLFLRGRSAASGQSRFLPLFRGLVHLLVLAALAASLARSCEFPDQDTDLQVVFFHSLLMLFFALLASAAAYFPGYFGDRRPKWLRGIDLGLTSLLVTALFFEAAFLIASRYSSSKIFLKDYNVEESAFRMLERCRCPPGYPRFDFLFNSDGFFDEEFFFATENDFVAVALADSFGHGMVPYRYNFVTVAENILKNHLGERFGRVAVHNLGVSAIGMPEYFYLLKNKAELYHPSLVILCAFVGNDLVGWEGLRPPPRCFLQSWWVGKMSTRLYRVYWESRRRAWVEDTRKVTDLSHERLDYLCDPSLEKPTFLEEQFLYIERDRARVLRANDREVEREYQSFFSALLHFKKALGDKLLLVLIPDEIQVNDRLFDQVISGSALYDREYPQKKIAEFCRIHAIDLLDLLPRLRTMEQNERTYLLRDTHWNTLGNTCAGEAIGRHILRTRFSIDSPERSFDELKEWIVEERKK